MRPLTRHREEMERRGAGPQKANEALVAYLEAERDLGRVRDDADPEAAAAMLLVLPAGVLGELLPGKT